MKAIILAAGEGTRLKPITNLIPKPLIKIDEKPIIEHNLVHIYKKVSEIIIIIKFKGELIKDYFGNNYKGTKITYHTQGNKKGTGGAIKGINFIDDVLILNGDSIFDQKDIENILNFEGYGVLVKNVECPEKYGIFQIGKNNQIIKVVEKPTNYIGNLASLGLYKFNSSIFNYIDELQLSKRGEYELTDALNMYARDNSLYTINIKGNFVDIGYIEDIIKKNNEYFNTNFRNPKIGDFFPLEKIGEYIFGIGFPESEIDSIINYSNDLSDKALRKNTSDAKRFQSKEKLIKWYNDEGRFVFSIISEEGKIAGFYQARPSKFPNIIEIKNKDLYSDIDKNNIHTSGIRLYPNFRGQKLAVPLINLAHKYYNILYPNFCLSIDIDSENISSQKSFEKSGFHFLGYGENKKTIGKSNNKRMLYIKTPK